jgi:hypothetical protein
MQPTSQNLINRTIAGYLKIYPTFARLVEFNDPIIVRDTGWENHGKIHAYHQARQLFGKDVLNELRSTRRTQTLIRDYCLSNRFDIFATLTLAQDRYNTSNNRFRIHKWLENQKKIHGGFKYILVPELHKDGATHFHGLFEGYSGNLRQTNHRKSGRYIYNLTSYRSGFSTAVYIRDGDSEKVGQYLSKYITKTIGNGVEPGKKRYFASKNLISPKKFYNPSEFQLKDYEFKQLFKNDNITVLHGLLSTEKKAPELIRGFKTT